MALRRCPGGGTCSDHQVVRHQEAARRRGQQRPSPVGVGPESGTHGTMESARSAFHAQLATVMDSLLAAAVCEIAKIFESSLCEQQAELTHKTKEICILRGRLERVERRQKAKGAGGEDGEVSSGDREGHTAPGPTVEKVPSSQSDSVEGVGQGLGRLKEEVIGKDGASVKTEHAGSRPVLGSTGVPDRTHASGDQRDLDIPSDTRAKVKLSHWDPDSRSADHRTLQNQASSTPFLSISQSGCSSPRPDPSLAQTGEWLSALDATQSEVSSLENPQAGGTSCSGPAISSTGADAPCYRPSFGSDGTSNKDDEGSFPFLDQEPENQNSMQGQDQAPSDETPWRPGDNRLGGRGPINNTRRVTSFAFRDPLRSQSNSQLLTPRHTNSLSHAAASGGGNGRPYTCPYCSKCFTYPSHQRRHLLRHTGVRLHPCQFCNKSFLTPSELTVHTRTHTGERPFGCAQCGKRFARSGNLRAHQRDVHMGKRPFACTECGKRFAHRGNLRVHNHRVHQGDPYYIDDQEPDMVPNPV